MQDPSAHLLKITEQQLLFQTQLHQLADQITSLIGSIDGTKPLADDLSNLAGFHRQINNSIKIARQLTIENMRSKIDRQQPTTYSHT